MAQRTITGTIYKPDGTAWVGGEVLKLFILGDIYD